MKSLMEDPPLRQRGLRYALALTAALALSLVLVKYRGADAPETAPLAGPAMSAPPPAAATAVKKKKGPKKKPAAPAGPELTPTQARGARLRDKGEAFGGGGSSRG
jgi:hypothetical protein